MATHIRAGAVPEENPLALAANAKGAALKPGAGLLNQGSKRRALGDIGNVVGKGNTAVAAQGKEKVDPALVAKARPITRSLAKQEGKDAPGVPKAPAVVVPRTRAQAAAAAAARQQGASLSSLLQTRSEAAVTAVKPPLSPLPDIDSQDRNNPLMATDYVNDIYNYYRRVEPKYRVGPGYMADQKEINEKMRGILVDWLVEVHLKFKLMTETLYLTVNLIDRFLAQKQVTRKNLQLVGVTCMLIASKYEETWAPEVRDFVYICDKAYTREQILAMEKLVLSTLGFNLTVPTPYNFMARFLKAANSHLDREVTNLASYFAELSLPDISMLSHSYSILSAAAVYAARKILKREDPYPKALAKHCGFQEVDVLQVATQLVQLAQKNAGGLGSLKAVFKKYSSTKFLEAANVVIPDGLFA